MTAGLTYGGLEMDQKYLEAARADYDALYKDRDMIQYLAELYVELHKMDPENYNIDSHWSLAKVLD